MKCRGYSGTLYTAIDHTNNSHSAHGVHKANRKSNLLDTCMTVVANNDGIYEINGRNI